VCVCVCVAVCCSVLQCVAMCQLVEKVWASFRRRGGVFGLCVSVSMCVCFAACCNVLQFVNSSTMLRLLYEKRIFGAGVGESECV